MKQTEKIIKYLNENGSITTFQAFNELGITRLASRINDLKNEGYSIRSKTVTKNGKHWSEYFFEE